jgi:hypothetical protein
MSSVTATVTRNMRMGVSRCRRHAWSVSAQCHRFLIRNVKILQKFIDFGRTVNWHFLEFLFLLHFFSPQNFVLFLNEKNLIKILSLGVFLRQKNFTLRSTNRFVFAEPKVNATCRRNLRRTGKTYYALLKILPENSWKYSWRRKPFYSF